jgi:hypothetical protein
VHVRLSWVSTNRARSRHRSGREQAPDDPQEKLQRLAEDPKLAAAIVTVNSTRMVQNALRESLGVNNIAMVSPAMSTDGFGAAFGRPKVFFQVKAPNDDHVQTRLRSSGGPLGRCRAVIARGCHPPVTNFRDGEIILVALGTLVRRPAINQIAQTTLRKVSGRSAVTGAPTRPRGRGAHTVSDLPGLTLRGRTGRMLARVEK